jgi:hypothetical protein
MMQVVVKRMMTGVLLEFFCLEGLTHHLLLLWPIDIWSNLMLLAIGDRSYTLCALV